MLFHRLGGFFFFFLQGNFFCKFFFFFHSLYYIYIYICNFFFPQPSYLLHWPRISTSILLSLRNWNMKKKKKISISNLGWVIDQMIEGQCRFTDNTKKDRQVYKMQVFGSSRFKYISKTVTIATIKPIKKIWVFLMLFHPCMKKKRKST